MLLLEIFSLWLGVYHLVLGLLARGGVLAVYHGDLLLWIMNVVEGSSGIGKVAVEVHGSG